MAVSSRTLKVKLPPLFHINETGMDLIEISADVARFLEDFCIASTGPTVAQLFLDSQNSRRKSAVVSVNDGFII